MLFLRSLLCLFVGCCFSFALAQEREFTVLEYNVENLYDTLHDAGKDDFAFLPDGKRRWTAAKYWKKLGRLATVIAAAGYPAPTDVIGLCEVENDSVVKHLTQHTRLRQFGYEYLITHSNDPRGIDVALLYQPLRFSPIYHESLSVPPISPRHRPTRDILYVAGGVPTGDTLHVFLCHFPSRSSGKNATEAYRCAAASVVRQRCDSIFALCPEAKIVVMGDFNDEADNKALHRVLGSHLPNKIAEGVIKNHFYTLSHRLSHPSGAKGSYFFQGEWNQIDHFIVSGTLLVPSSSFRTKQENCELFCPPFLYEQDKTQLSIQPKRTYLGDYYHGGYSDHFPLRLRFFY